MVTQISESTCDGNGTLREKVKVQEQGALVPFERTMAIVIGLFENNSVGPREQSYEISKWLIVSCDLSQHVA